MESDTNWDNSRDAVPVSGTANSKVMLKLTELLGGASDASKDKFSETPMINTRRMCYDVRARISMSLIQSRRRVSKWIGAENVQIPLGRRRTLSEGRRLCGWMNLKEDEALGLLARDSHINNTVIGYDEHDKADIELSADEAYRETEELLFTDYIAHGTAMSFRMTENLYEILGEKRLANQLHDFMNARSKVRSMEAELLNLATAISQSARDLDEAEAQLKQVEDNKQQMEKDLLVLIQTEAKYGKKLKAARTPRTGHMKTPSNSSNITAV